MLHSLMNCNSCFWKSYAWTILPYILITMNSRILWVTFYPCVVAFSKIPCTQLLLPLSVKKTLVAGSRQ
uniref:Uncharacterized protein n=1 Tax=Rhizophora mucronata TaxID=61149 RepID=A0A2P2N009_RHIMU